MFIVKVGVFAAGIAREGPTSKAVHVTNNVNPCENPATDLIFADRETVKEFGLGHGDDLRSRGKVFSLQSAKFVVLGPEQGMCRIRITTGSRAGQEGLTQ